MARKRAFRIGRSRTGLGLFATAPIKKGAFIVEYKGRMLTTEQADKLDARGSRYLYEINSRWTIDETSRKNLGRYVNHSCRPNAETHTIGHKVIIRAIKNIRTGADYLQLWLRLSDQHHHAAWLQKRQVPEATSQCPREGTRQRPMSRTTGRPLAIAQARFALNLNLQALFSRGGALCLSGPRVNWGASDPLPRVARGYPLRLK
jgi:hypothetical protein